MITNRKVDHIGMPTIDMNKDVQWYIDVLGFSVTGHFIHPCGAEVKFISNGHITYEVYEAENDQFRGKIDHIAYVSENIEADYQECLEKGYKITTDGIEGIPTYWEKGVRYFKIESPSGEQIEYCQVL